MKNYSRFYCVVLAVLTSALVTVAQPQSSTALAGLEKPWMFGPFQKQNAVNPILAATSKTTFACPVRGETVHWEEKDVFNPAAVVRNGKVYMIYRAEDVVGKFAGTSRLGLAVSSDGIHFKRQPKPVFYPDNDEMKTYEWEGGCEDPRIVESPNGVYVMTYTAYDGDKARLCVATSANLTVWKKHGLAFDQFDNSKYRNEWSKSGSIVCKRVGSKLIAQKINDKYWMYWGDKQQLFMATSDDLIHWQPIETKSGKLAAAAEFRPGKHDYQVLEPGPPALITPEGIVLIYNGMNEVENGDTALPDDTYAGGQMLFDAADPTKLVDRSSTYFIKPDQPYELVGQVNNVCFLEGMVPFKGRWFLYYGTADSKIAVTVAPMR